MIDLRIENGIVIDGSGADRFAADVAVDGGRIVAVGNGVGGQARRVIDAHGQVVAPGFVDLHTHYDAQWFWDPTASSSCWHGVTTVLTGNCGFTLAPVATDADRSYMQRLFSQVEGVSMDLLDQCLDWSWRSFGDYLERIRPALGVNVAAQVGHSALRHSVMGEASREREATEDEIAAMAAEVERSLAAGAIGYSTLQADFESGPDDQPIPSQLASHDELRALAAAVGRAGGGLVTVSPHPGAADISDAYQRLMIDMSKASGGAVLWNAFQHRWDQPERWRDLLEYMRGAEREGARVFSVAKCQRLDLEFDLIDTRLFVWFPSWHEAIMLPEAEKRARFADPAVRARMHAEFSDPAQGPSQMAARERLVVVLESATHPEWIGRNMREIARETGRNLTDAILDLALEDDLATRFVYQGLMNGDMNAVSAILSGPHCLPGVSDAGAHLDMDCGVDFTARLLGYWVREQKLLSLEEAVRRLTSMSFDVLGVADRGRLAAGAAADIVIFAPDAIGAEPREWRQDVPGGGRRIVQRAVGVEQVMVNGEVLIERGEHTGALPGQVIERNLGASRLAAGR